MGSLPRPPSKHNMPWKENEPPSSRGVTVPTTGGSTCQSLCVPVSESAPCSGMTSHQKPAASLVAEEDSHAAKSKSLQHLSLPSQSESELWGHDLPQAAFAADQDLPQRRVPPCDDECDDCKQFLQSSWEHCFVLHHDAHHDAQSLRPRLGVPTKGAGLWPGEVVATTADPSKTGSHRRLFRHAMIPC